VALPEPPIVVQGDDIPWDLPPLPPLPYELRERLGVLEASCTQRSRADALLELQIDRLRHELGSAEAAAARSGELERELERSRHHWARQLELARSAHYADTSAGAGSSLWSGDGQWRPRSATAPERERPGTPVHQVDDPQRLQAQLAAQLEREADSRLESQAEYNRLAEELRESKAENSRLQSDLVGSREESRGLLHVQTENSRLQAELIRLREEVGDLQKSDAEARRLYADSIGPHEEAEEALEVMREEARTALSRAEFAETELAELRGQKEREAATAEAATAEALRTMKVEASVSLKRAEQAETEVAELRSRNGRDAARAKAENAELLAEVEGLRRNVQELTNSADTVREELRLLELRSRRDVAELQAQKSELQLRHDRVLAELQESERSAASRLSQTSHAFERRPSHSDHAGDRDRARDRKRSSSLKAHYGEKLGSDVRGSCFVDLDALNGDDWKSEY